jgi:PAS domain S-box-containing protein
MTHPFKPVIPQGASEQSVDCQSRDKTDSRTENDKHLRSFYDNSPIAYHSLDSEGRFIEINPAWLQMLGYTREEVIGRWAGDFLIPEQVEVFKERFPLFKKLGAIHKVPFNFLRKDGGVVAVEVDGRIAYDEQGDFLQTHCVLHDVTERKRAKQMSEALRIKENQYRELFESGSDALLLIAIATGRSLIPTKWQLYFLVTSGMSC